MPESTIDLLLINGQLLCMDVAGTQHSPGFVAISGSRISALGPMSALGADLQRSAGELIDCSGCIVMPGLINCHTHLPMVYFRGLADDLPLDDWLRKYIWPAEAKYLTAQFCYDATRLAAAECIKGGVTCVNDMYLYAGSVAQALADCGLRGLVGEGVIQFPTPSAPDWQAGLKLSEKLIADFAGHPLITPTVAPHSPYTCTPEILEAAQALARRGGVPLHTHLHETVREPGDIAWRNGAESPAAALSRIGLLDEHLIAAHCVHLNSDDIGLLAQHRCSVAHCPGSNLKLASGIAPLSALLAAGVHVGAGTDGAASNNNLSLWEELSLAAQLAKGGRELNAQAVPARTAIELGTRRAAAALKRSDIGTLAAGLLADVIVVDCEALHLAPQYPRPEAAYSLLAYSAQAGDVRDTIVNGRLLMRQRRLTTLDELSLIHAAQTWVETEFGGKG